MPLDSLITNARLIDPTDDIVVQQDSSNKTLSDKTSAL